jgi:hypothetical protein
MQRQPIIGRFRRLTECGRASELPVSARLLGLHALPGRTELPRPTPDSHGPFFNITKAGISDAASHTHQFEAKLNECEPLVGGNAPESFG